MSFRNSGPLECKVYVGNLGNQGSKGELEEAFRKYGTLKNVWVARNPPGFAFVEFEDSRDAEDSVRDLDGRTICGVRARVELSSGRSRRGNNDRGDGGDRYRNDRGGGGRRDDFHGGGGRRDDDRRRRSRSPRRRMSRSRSPRRRRSRSRSRSPYQRRGSPSPRRSVSPPHNNRSSSRSPVGNYRDSRSRSRS